MRVAQGGVDDLVDGELAHVARHRELHQILGIGSDHLELAQHREVHDRGALTAGPVFLQRSGGVEAGRHPEPAILLHLPGQGRGAWMKARLTGEARFGIGGHAVAHTLGEGAVGIVDPDVDVRGAPAVGGIDVVGAGRGGADEVGQRPQQDVIARA
jgi:hypothetical protein